MSPPVLVAVALFVSTVAAPTPPTPPTLTTGQKALPAQNDPNGPALQWWAAPGDGATLWAKDGSWSLNARARIQLRAAATSDPTSDDVDELLAAEFLVRRARLAFKGMLFQDVIRWNLQLGLSQNDVELDRPIIVRDAWVQWNAPLGVGLRVGQMKVPFDRQRQVSSSALQFADRTRTMTELTLDRDIGLQLMHMGLLDKRLVVQAGLFGGDGRNRPTPNSGFLSVGRVQLQPFGAFDDLAEGDLERRETPALAIAAAGGTSVRTTRVLATTGRVLEKDGSEGLLDYGHATVDAVFKWHGFSLFLAGLGRVGFDDHGAPEPIARSAVGGIVQAGVMTIGGLELVARASHTQPIQLDGMAENDPGLVAEWEASGGVNFYWLGHDFKLQTDVGAIGPEGGPVRAFGRTQLQLFF
jgi:phosphate-selective porin OprO/OprP